MRDIEKEYDMTKEQFTDMLAIQWRYSKKVYEVQGKTNYTYLIRFKSEDGLFTAEYSVNKSYWDMVKPEIIKKANLIK